MNKEENIRYNIMKNTYNWWSKEYKSIGLILWFVCIYCSFHLAEILLIGDKKITYPNGKLFAEYKWNEKLKIPIFKFLEKENTYIYIYEENQNIYIKGIQ